MNITPAKLDTAASLFRKKTPATAPSKAAETDEDKKLRENVRKFVSQTFFGPMLRQMRESPFKDDKFSGGRGGEAFAQMFDQQLADRLGNGSGEKLIDSIVKKMKGTGRAHGFAHHDHGSHATTRASETTESAEPALQSAASLQRSAAFVKARINFQPSITK